MPKYKVMVIKYGFADIEAESESQAQEMINNMRDHDFQWSDFDYGEVLEEIDYEY